jgi:hypothetical protein
MQSKTNISSIKASNDYRLSIASRLERDGCIFAKRLSWIAKKPVMAGLRRARRLHPTRARGRGFLEVNKSDTPARFSILKNLKISEFEEVSP